MTKTKNLLLTILLVCGATVWGNNGLKISGRIKVLKPTTLQIKDMNEGVVSVRRHAKGDEGAVLIADFVSKIKKEIEERQSN